MSKKSKNFGFIARKPKEEDYLFEGLTQVPQEVLVEDGQWDKYLPKVEYQLIKRTESPGHFETSCCVTFSCLNCLELIHKRKYNEEPNFSDRFTCVISGTTPGRGNFMYKVADSVRKNDGHVDQEVYTNSAKTQKSFYKKIPANIIQTGKENLKDFDIKYEWVRPVNERSLKEALKYSPIQIAIPTNWKKDKDGIYHQREPKTRCGHAVTLYGYEEGKYWKIYDHYQGNEIRHLAWDYYIGYAMKFYLTKKNNEENMNNILYKTSGQPELYYLGKDGLYHHILNEATFKMIWGDFKNVEIKEARITAKQIGNPLAAIVK